MKTRWMMITIVLLLSLVATSSVSAGQGPQPPTWEVVFDSAKLGASAEAWYGVVFKGKLYFQFSYIDTGDQVWGTSDGRHWSLAWEPSSIQEGLNSTGPMIVFKDHLYVVVGNWDGLYPGGIFRTTDGKNWEPVAIAETDENIAWFNMFTSFKGDLYAVFAYDNEGVITNHLWRSSSGNPGTWEDVAQFPWGVAAFADFKGALYAGSDWYDGGPTQVWRSFDGKNWEPVITDGFNNPQNINTGGFAKKGSYLYFGTGSFEGGADIWRTKDGKNWEMVTQNGLGNPNNLGFVFVTYQNLLYTFAYNEVDGCSAYNSKDGMNWTPANAPGWGDPANVGVMRDGARVIFKGKLYLRPLGPIGIVKLAKP